MIQGILLIAVVAICNMQYSTGLTDWGRDPQSRSHLASGLQP